jgi:signal transduction histidine kinase
MSADFIFFLSFFVPVLMGLLSLLSWRKERSKEFTHLTEFWLSIAVMVVISYIFHHQNEHIVAISLVGWLWPLKTISLFLEDLTGMSFINRTRYLVLASGIFVSLVMAGFGYTFFAYTIPFSLVVGGLGLNILYEVYKEGKAFRTHLHNATYFFLGCFFLLRLFYPVWRFDEQLMLLGFTANLLILICLAGSTLSLYMSVMRERHEHQLNTIVRERNDQLFSQSKYSELGMMSAGIAHEINNPLAIIQAKTTQLLRIYRKPERQQDLADGLQQILITSERINRTIQGVREFVHQDDRLPDEDISLKKLIDDVLAFCGQRMKNHGINLRFYGLENHAVRGHKVQLEQVILNLLNNSFDAIEYLSEKWIEVSVQESEDMTKIFFKDSGKGIPADIAKHVMEPFFTTKKLEKGTGLGLALAKGIVEKHGGCLSYIQDANHTTFLLELPKPGLHRLHHHTRDLGHNLIH